MIKKEPEIKKSLLENENEYELNVVISPIFGKNYHDKVINSKVTANKKNPSVTLEDYVEQKTKENMIHQKNEEYTNSTIINSRVQTMENEKKQQEIYENLPSRYLEFRDKFNDKIADSETITNTIDILVDDILSEKTSK